MVIQASDIPSATRPATVKLLDGRQDPFTKTGNRRKVYYVDVEPIKSQLEIKRLQTPDMLNKVDQELGIGYE